MSFLFNGLDRGFSETWGYNSTADIQASDRQQIRVFAQLRTALCAPQWRCVAARIVDTSQLRVSELLSLEVSSKAGPFPQNADVPSTAWLLRATAANGAKRQVWLRGGDDEWITFDAVANRFIVSPELLKRVDKWKALFFPIPGEGLSPWTIGRIGRSAQAGTDTQAVTAINTDALNRPTLTVAAAPWTADENIIVSGFKKPWSYLNGTYTPAAWQKAGLVVTLMKPVLGTFIAANFAGVRVRRRTVTLIRLNALDFVRAGSRRTGRAFFVPVGRR